MVKGILMAIYIYIYICDNISKACLGECIDNDMLPLAFSIFKAIWTRIPQKMTKQHIKDIYLAYSSSRDKYTST